MIKASAACMSKNVEKVSFELIDFESTVSEKGAADSLEWFKQYRKDQFANIYKREKSNIPVETANVKYHSLLNEQADSKETLKTILDKLHQGFKIGRELKHLVVVGDGKTYDILIKLKLELKDDLSGLNCERANRKHQVKLITVMNTTWKNEEPTINFTTRPYRKPIFNEPLYDGSKTTILQSV
ncbi:guaA [Mytilus coruscus]|uniref:GuaA n=1 Tax=Mytilus coruscus TaxID=42192 RepID=A0A6J8EMK3_MYTCO|nr:guaA [Mytilus coruscus]